MEEGSHSHGHRPHGGGTRWLDISLAHLRDKVGLEVCYCSVFDECYLRDSDHREPARVKACPALTTPYKGD